MVLYNLVGSIVKAGTNQLSIADVQHGIYIVKATVNGKQLVKKLLK
ncbi:hypothetical protein FACS1894176_09820 [Bacteroidia bacterium]|nr:hypothetical protein FACS1894176_09820 [Bacteroidia bacterium]